MGVYTMSQITDPEKGFKGKNDSFISFSFPEDMFYMIMRTQKDNTLFYYTYKT